LGVGIDQHGAAGFEDGFGHGAEDCLATFIGRRVVQRAQALEVIIVESFGLLDELPERFGSGRFDEAIGIVRRGDDGDADGQPGGEERIEGSHGGILAGLVGVEAEHDFVHVPFEDAGVVGGEGGSLGGDDVFDTGHEAGDQRGDRTHLFDRDCRQ